MDTIRVAHISDLHFGAQGQHEVWELLRDYLNDTLKPNFILITGDIAHTPDMDLFTKAKSQLDLLRVQRSKPSDAYRVCPGNHDRHPLGNAPGQFASIVRTIRGWRGVSSWFDNAFTGRSPTIANPERIELEVGKNQWNLWIIGCDTSAKAEYTALGFAPPGDLDGLPASATRDPEAHLVILMHHHHLLSIWELEKSRQQLRDMFKPTIMVNAGTMLEALTRGHVNIVLHGHEHHKAYARYGTVQGQQGEL
jgi:3',5'-cyclic AMP phosphodiesterase CpdA